MVSVGEGVGVQVGVFSGRDVLVGVVVRVLDGALVSVGVVVVGDWKVDVAVQVGV